MPTQILKLLSSTVAELPDAELLNRFATARDEAAFTEILRRHGPLVYRVCRQLVGTSAADDAFQSTFLVLACRAKALRKAGSVGSWLIGVAGRVSRQMRKQNQRYVLRSVEVEDRINSGPPADLAAILDDELSRLPDNLRSPVVLCMVEGRTYKQGATILGWSARTLRRRLDRAKAVLRLRLERRGVVPAVALGLVSSLESRTTAVSPQLTQRVMDEALQFLTSDRVLTPTGVVAKGVAGSMSKPMMPVMIAAATVVLIGLGIVLADDSSKRTGPSGPAATAQIGNQVTAIPVTNSPRTHEQPQANQTSSAKSTSGVRNPDHTYHTWNDLTVSAPTQTMNRVIAREVEFQLLDMSQTWLGQKWSRAWEEKCEIQVTIEEGKGSGTTVFEFNDPGPTLNRRALMRVRMELRGSLEEIIANQLPREVTRTFLAYYSGKPISPWAEAGVIALQTLSEEQQIALDTRCRKLLTGGKCTQWIDLFRNTKHTATEPAQEHSIVRYLLTRQPNDDLGSVLYRPDGERVRCVDTPGEPYGTNIIDFDANNRHHSLLAFVRVGMIGNTPESWNRAAKEVYGVESVDWLERAWKGWLEHNPKSVMAKPPASPTPPAGTPRPGLPPPSIPNAGPIPKPSE